MTSRERLIEAMAGLMWERGYTATSPRDVLTRAGVGQGSMYHHFAGKHDLAVETLKDVAASVVGESKALDGGGSPLERLEHYLGRPRAGTQGCRVGRMTQDPEVVRDTELITIVADAFSTVLGRWRQVIAEAVAAGELPSSVDPTDLAHTLVAVVQGGYVLARAQGSQEPMDAAVRGALQLLDSLHAATTATPQSLPPKTSASNEGE